MVAAIVLGYPVVEADRFYRHIRLVGQPVARSRTPSKMAARPPELGEQTDAVLAEFGFSADGITELKRGKVI
jgi:crotonobetainyl-CoA:carnitine CoA-transferase CaiB-like acyl-CoA transferase